MSNTDTDAKEMSDLFLSETAEFVDQAEACLLVIEKNRSDSAALDTLFRSLHNIKGGAKSFGFFELATLGHHMETLLVSIRSGAIVMSTDVLGLMLKCCDTLRHDVQRLKECTKATAEHPDLYELLARALEAKPLIEVSAMELDENINRQEVELQNGSTRQGSVSEIKNKVKASRGNEIVRISLDKVEDLLNNFGEQVILQATLDHIKYDLENNRDIAIKTINQLSKLTYDLQQTTIALRMVSLKQLFSKLERTARDTSVSTSKKIQFISDGQENEIDKAIADAIFDPLNHMVRNAVDHGLESPEDRIKTGKSDCGKITLKGFRRGGFFYITIEDDGKGLDKEKIFKNAIKNGIIKADAVLSESEIYELIYANGLSTRDTANDISGRGVGMNVVKESIHALKGSCQIHSKIGEGTRFTIRLPLSLAIFNGMVVRIEESLYIIPNSDVERILAMPQNAGRMVSEANDRIIDIGDSIIPLVDLRDKLNVNKTVHQRKSKGSGTLIVTHTGHGRHAVIVDEIVSQQRIVHKSLGAEVSQLKGVTGVTILGDGRAALILDLSVWLIQRIESAA